MIKINIYGIYKNVRDAAWRCLAEHRIDKLPVDILHIARMTGIKIIKNSSVNELSLSESGASLFDGAKWYIIYDDENTVQRARFTIAHEFGHIFLGHELRKGRHARTFDISKPQVEKEADSFAARLLAPACVLWGLSLHSPQEIADVCNISLAAAKIRAERMSVLYDRNKFLTSPLEKTVYDNFRKYIETNRA